MAVPVLESFTSNTINATTGLVLTKPAGVIPGDLLVIMASTDATATSTSISTPAGYTVVYMDDGTGTNTIGSFWKVADGTEDSTVSIAVTGSLSGFLSYGGAWLRISGAGVVTPIDVIGTHGGTTTTIHTIAAVTTTEDDCLAICHYSLDNTSGTSVLSGTGWTEIVQYDTGATASVAGQCVIGEKDIATTGTSGTATVTSSVSDRSSTIMYAIAPLGNGISAVNPAAFEANDTFDIYGLDFEATQASGSVYISDVNSLAGGVNEVDITSAVSTWSNTSVGMDLTLLDAGERTSLDGLGPGARYIILVNDTGAEYASLSSVALSRAKAITLKASANITAAGENTTFQLLAPSGSTTADFGGGRIQDDVNPTGGISLLAGEYREDEWCIEATADSFLTETYEFRLLYSGTEATTITVTPELTVEAGVTPSTRNRIFLIS